MGFMDKAKKLAEQAQQKLDEAQQSFNQGGSTQGQQPGGVRFDERGRPVQGEREGSPAAEPRQDPADSAPDPFKPLER